MDRYSSLIKDHSRLIMSSLSHYDDYKDTPRTRDLKLLFALHSLTNVAFPDVQYELSHRNEWMDDWHGREVSVQDAFFSLMRDGNCKKLIKARNVEPSSSITNNDRFDRIITSLWYPCNFVTLFWMSIIPCLIQIVLSCIQPRRLSRIICLIE